MLLPRRLCHIKYSIVSGLSFLFLPSMLLASNFSRLFETTLTTDHQYLNKLYTEHSVQDATAINRAKFFPTIGAYGSYTKASQTPLTLSYGLTISQSIINFNNIFNQAGADEDKRAAFYSMLSAWQDLAARFSSAYFNMAAQQAELLLDQQSLKLDHKITAITTFRYHAGQITHADIDTAKLNALSDQAQVITDKAKMVQAKTALTLITAKEASTVPTLSEHFKLAAPNPSQYSQWQQLALRQNPLLRSDWFHTQSLQSALSAINSNYLPTVDANLNYANGQYDASGHNVHNSSWTGALNLNMPIFSGFSTSANSQQARNQYLAQIEQTKLDIATVKAQSQAAFYQVYADIKTYHLLTTTERLSHKNYSETLLAYKAGLKTVNDVVTAKKTLVQTEKSLLDSRYQYLADYIKLKQAVGALNMQDIRRIDSWFA